MVNPVLSPLFCACVRLLVVRPQLLTSLIVGNQGWWQCVPMSVQGGRSRWSYWCNSLVVWYTDLGTPLVTLLRWKHAMDGSWWLLWLLQWPYLSGSEEKITGLLALKTTKGGFWWEYSWKSGRPLCLYMEKYAVCEYPTFNKSLNSA